MDSVICPDVTAPLHEFEPAYAPVMVLVDACPSPLTVALHVWYGLSNPPAGTVIVKRTVEPDTVPDTDPLPRTALAVSVIVRVPEKDVSPESCQVNDPLPDESVAEPVQRPATLTAGGAVGVGDDGDVPDDPLVQPTKRTANSVHAGRMCGRHHWRTTLERSTLINISGVA